MSTLLDRTGNYHDDHGLFAGHVRSETTDLDLGPEPGEEAAWPMPGRLSVSKLDSFGSCGLRYFLDEVAQAAPDEIDLTADGRTERARAKARGVAFHHAIDSPDPFGALNELAGSAELDSKTAAEVAELIRGWKVLRPNGPPRGTETEAEVAWKVRGIPFVGYIDGIEPCDDGTVRIVEYKTGSAHLIDGATSVDPRLPVRAHHLDPDGSITDHVLQVATYAQAHERATGELVSEIQVLYPKPVYGKPTSVTVPWTPELRERTRIILEHQVDQMSDAYVTGNFRSRSGVACSSCTHQAKCPTPPIATSRMGR